MSLTGAFRLPASRRPAQHPQWVRDNIEARGVPEQPSRSGGLPGSLGVAPKENSKLEGFPPLFIRRYHRKRKGTSSREFNLSVHDLPQQIDVLFAECDGDHLGEVVSKASPAGQRAVEKLFPNADIAWREVDGQDKSHFPDHWREVCFVIPWLLANLDHGLRRDLLALRQFDELSPDQFAFLMMESTNEQSARAAFWSIDNRLVQVSMPSQCN